MARQKRLNIPGVPQHVVQRGNNRQPCFHNDADCQRFLEILHRACMDHDCQLHAFVLMANHAHLLVSPAAGDGVTWLMRDLGRSYVRYFNDTYRRTGTLWEGRFRSSLVDSERYLLACYRYIELNPVRALLVGAPGDYPWSSYHVNALGRHSDLITPHRQWLSLGNSHQARLKRYRALFERPLKAAEVERMRRGLRKGLPVGSASFKREIERKTGLRLSTGRRGRPKG